MHRAKGVEVRLGATVSALRGKGTVSAVALADGTEIPADVVVIGIGIIPNTELAEGAGAASADGVVTDEFGRTSIDGLWAAGDVTSHYNPVLERRVRLESWQNAQNQAIAVARNVVNAIGTIGKPVAYAEVPWFWSDQHGVNIQMVGLAAPGAQTVWRGDPAAGRAIAFSMIDERIVCATAFNSGGEIRFARKLIESRMPVGARALADSGTETQGPGRPQRSRRRGRIAIQANTGGNHVQRKHSHRPDRQLRQGEAAGGRVRIQVARRRIDLRAGLDLHQSRDLRARDRADFPWPHLEFRRAGSGDPESGRLQALVRRPDPRGGVAQHRRDGACVRKPLRASRRGVLPPAPGQHQGIRVPVPQLDLRPGRQPAGRARSNAA